MTAKSRRKRPLPLRLFRNVERTVVKHAFSGPRAMQRSLSVWPPLSGSGVAITNISDDWSHGEVVLKLGPLNRNMHGAAFGGTLFAMTDVLFGTLVMKRLGRDFEAWTRTGTFQYLNPGRSGARLMVDVDDTMVADILEHISHDGYYNVSFTSVIRNPDGTVAGIGQQDLHVRPRKGREAERSAEEAANAIPGVGSLPRGVEDAAPAYEPKGITLASLVTAVAWRAWGDREDVRDRGGLLNSVLSHARRIPLPEERARYVCAEVLERGDLSREQILELRIPEHLLP
ncbi:MAG TPA: DUF4442 domain-containing protein [Candidatus Corynebacterium avicola]|uniref:DUF4442 domain-containing protein n=1 Tax=Candidatus Corynebacterium avicola TaxID=2838527 RepID=A0A9D1UKY9_9CORY|nr:DUF4442 domain-containing protein [Candidatus Corynebacterium avicola]